MTARMEPDQYLTFQRPLTQLVTEKLLIHNDNDAPLAFKVKTTAPRQYCVRPNAGLIEAHSHQEVKIMLQPFRMEPEPDYNCKDKFLVQTILVSDPSVQEKPINDLWTHMETVAKDQIQQHKLRCAYVPENEKEAPVPADDKAIEPQTAKGEMDRASDELQAMQKKIQAYEQELASMRKNVVHQEPSKGIQVPLHVLLMVAVAVFAVTYALLSSNKQ
ncbi:hypothetical protein LRAMOSA08629 [Lichtheimia ramosa]|uniref:MSP domain-containing protein n=1 Tax=Lichtheimia ramosa TaxID=688394 RepID=A0A077WEP3_9FUNG|nr:hypothetical protein LRAMOSA08629 [Lichtheimia ramosa]